MLGLSVAGFGLGDFFESASGWRRGEQIMASTSRLQRGSTRFGVIAGAVVIAGFGIWTHTVPWAAASTSSGDRAIFEPVTPARILDTRFPSPTPLGPGESRLVQVAGVGGVPADATAVALNVTAVEPTSGGYLTVYPADVATVPTVSNVNFRAGQIVPNAVVVKIGSTGANVGQIKILNSAGQTNVIVDVGGYFRGHDHDDRYYTKAQAQARTALNALTCPAGQYLQAADANGAPTCASTVAGPGIAVAGNTVSSAAGATLVPVRGDDTPAANAAGLRAALAAITDATSTKPYVLQLAPGTFDLATTSLNLQPFVSLVGSGLRSTKIVGTYSSTILTGLVGVADQVRVADLSIVNGPCTAAVSQCNAVVISGSATLDAVEVRTDAGSARFGNAVRTNGAVTVMNSIIAGGPTSASGGETAGIIVDSGTLTVRGSQVSSTHPSGYGITNIGGTARVFDSEVTANAGALYTVQAVRSVIAGVASFSTCVFSVKADLTTPTNSSCG